MGLVRKGVGLIKRGSGGDEGGRELMMEEGG